MGNPNSKIMKLATLLMIAIMLIIVSSKGFSKTIVVTTSNNSKSITVSGNPNCNTGVILSNSTFGIPVCVLDAYNGLPADGNGAPQFDQRGHAHVNTPDIGAYEYEGELEVCTPSGINAPWAPFRFGQDSWAFDMSIVNDSVVWVEDMNADSISITTNGGISWTSKPLPLPAGFPRAAGGICALSNTKAYYILSLSDSKGIYQTTDGGNNWIKQTTGFNQNSSFPDIIHFWNELHTCGNPGATTWEVLESLEMEVMECLYRRSPPDTVRAESLTAQAALLIDGFIDL